jgi:hypothetical protein
VGKQLKPSKYVQRMQKIFFVKWLVARGIVANPTSNSVVSPNFPTPEHTPKSSMVKRPLSRIEKFGKPLCRAKEVQLAAPGHCRDNTWEKLPEVLSHIPQENRLQAENLLSQQPSQDDLSQLIALLQQIVSKISCLDRIARLNRWKKQLRSSEQSTAKWLKSRNKKAYPCCWYNRSR